MVRDDTSTKRGEILSPLAGTFWQVTSIVPKPPKPFKSMISSFRQDGTVLTTTTHMDDTFENVTENYRIVGSTLIINKPDYVINSKFRMDGETLILDNGSSSIVMRRFVPISEQQETGSSLIRNNYDILHYGTK